MKLVGRIPSATRRSPSASAPGRFRVVSPKLTAPARDRRLHQVHRRRADERAHEQVRGVLEQPLRHVALLNHPVAQHRHPVAQRHRLDLVVGDVDGRRPEALVQAGEFAAHARAQLRVEVRERLVHEERPRLADQRPPHRHPLTLTARQRRRLAVHELAEPEHRRHPVDPLGDLRLRHLATPQPEGQVLAHRLVRIERVALKDHRQVAVGGLERGDVVVADPDAALGHLLEPGDHSQQGRLAAARGADEDDELAVGDLERDVVDREHVAVVDLGHPLDPHPRHRPTPPSAPRRSRSRP